MSEKPRLRVLSFEGLACICSIAKIDCIKQTEFHFSGVFTSCDPILGSFLAWLKSCALFWKC